MNRRYTHARLYVPTLAIAGEPRHILTERNGPTLCGTQTVGGAQWAPQEWGRGQLCPRCVQQHMKQVLDGRMEDFGL